MRSASRRSTEASSPSKRSCSRRRTPPSRSTARRPARSSWPSMGSSRSPSTTPSSTAISSMPSSWRPILPSTSCPTSTSRRPWPWKMMSNSSWPRTSSSRRSSPRRPSICTSTSAIGCPRCGWLRTTTATVSKMSWCTKPRILSIRTTYSRPRPCSFRPASRSWRCRPTPRSAWSTRRFACARSIARRCSETSWTPTATAARAARAPPARAWRRCWMLRRSTRRPATTRAPSTPTSPSTRRPPRTQTGWRRSGRTPCAWP
mmetsp:Transcript_86396/g.247921  ORF Transcript_86396/g.247921 Transcript_86396/m.247921 type:complete len:260 (-) Transcript_86396:1343-2122(-)